MSWHPTQSRLACDLCEWVEYSSSEAVPFCLALKGLAASASYLLISCLGSLYHGIRSLAQVLEAPSEQTMWISHVMRESELPGEGQWTSCPATLRSVSWWLETPSKVNCAESAYRIRSNTQTVAVLSTKFGVVCSTKIDTPHQWFSLMWLRGYQKAAQSHSICKTVSCQVPKEGSAWKGKGKEEEEVRSRGWGHKEKGTENFSCLPGARSSREQLHLGQEFQWSGSMGICLFLGETGSK